MELEHESEMLVIQSCPTLYDSMDCSPPGSSVHRTLQARILEWVAIPFSRGSSPPRDQTWVSRIAGRFLCCLSQMWNACGSNPRSHGILMLFRLRHHRPVNSSGEQKTCGSWRFGLGSRSLGWGRGGDAVFWEGGESSASQGGFPYETLPGSLGTRMEALPARELSLQELWALGLQLCQDS